MATKERKKTTLDELKQKVEINRPFILEYITIEDKKVGCLLAIRREDDTIGIGYSQLHRKDEFNKYVARNLAKIRAYRYSDGYNIKKLPFYIQTRYADFCKRAERYFKTNI